MAKNKEVRCPVCGAPMKQNMSKTMEHFNQHLNTVGVYDCTKCECVRIITTDDVGDYD